MEEFMNKDSQKTDPRAERLAAAEKYFEQRDAENQQRRERENGQGFRRGADYLNSVCMNHGKPFDRATRETVSLPDNWQELERAELVFQGLIPLRCIRATDKINPEKPPMP